MLAVAAVPVDSFLAVLLTSAEALRFPLLWVGVVLALPVMVPTAPILSSPVSPQPQAVAAVQTATPARMGLPVVLVVAVAVSGAVALHIQAVLALPARVMLAVTGTTTELTAPVVAVVAQAASAETAFCHPMAVMAAADFRGPTAFTTLVAAAVPMCFRSAATQDLAVAVAAVARTL